MKKLFCFLVQLMAWGTIQAQSVTPRVVPTAGGFFINSTASVSWTMGETATDLFSSSVSRISQGFQQPNFSNCSTRPGIPASITQTLVANVCGARVYRFTAATTANAIGYAWTLPTSVGGVSGVTVDSGDVLNSRMIKLKFTSNLSSLTTDNIFVRAFNTCGYSGNRSARLTNTNVLPNTPPSITQTLVSNVCGARVYRFTATTTTNADSYVWTLPASVGGVIGVTVDSGFLSESRIIKVRFASNLSALLTDSIWVRSVTICGFSAKRAAKLNNISMLPPAPLQITIQRIADLTCGKPRYRYTGPDLASATATTTAATGYEWSFTGTLGATAVVDSPAISSPFNSSKITVAFQSPAAAAVSGDSVRLRFSSSCGTTDWRRVKLTNTSAATNPPAVPSGITQSLVSDACGARVYRYTAPALTPSINSTLQSPNGYTWSLPVGPLGTTGVLDSGSLSCAGCHTIRIRYSSNAGAVTGDSIGLRFTSICGSSLKKSFKLTLPVSPPAAPAALTQTLVSSTCGAIIIRYSTTALPVGTSATGYRWVFSGGLFNLLGNSVIDSGTLTSQTLKVKYLTNAGAGTLDSAKVQYNSACGFGAFKSAKLINKALTCPTAAPPAVSKTTSLNPGQADNISVFPNPSRSRFILTLSAKEQYTILVHNLSGKLIRRIEKATGQYAFGDDLPSGIYILKIFNGEQMVVKKIVKM